MYLIDTIRTGAQMTRRFIFFQSEMYALHHEDELEDWQQELSFDIWWFDRVTVYSKCEADWLLHRLKQMTHYRPEFVIVEELAGPPEPTPIYEPNLTGLAFVDEVP
jgi:hypothetical protein